MSLAYHAIRPEATDSPHVPSMLSLPSWCNPEWKVKDLFLLSHLEMDALKHRVVNCLGCRFKANVSGKIFGLEVAGTAPLDPEACKFDS